MKLFYFFDLDVLFEVKNCLCLRVIEGEMLRYKGIRFEGFVYFE